MNRKDLIFGVCSLALILAALAPSWFDASRLPSNFGDLYAYHYPLRHLGAAALQSGRMPFWNPYIFSGLPLAANPQSVLFYPVSALWALFPLSLALSWDFTFHLFWAVLGVALVARQSDLGAASSWTLGLAYGLSPFLIYRVTAGIPTLLASLAWAPWCWLAWSSGRVGLLAAVWALQFFSGHPQFMLINACGMGLWALLGSAPGRQAGVLAREGVWAAALTAVQWVPTFEFLSESVRRSWPREFLLGYKVDWSALLSGLYPGALGEPVSGTYAGPPSVFFETCALYVGLPVLAAAFFGFWRSRRPASVAALLAVGGVMAFGVLTTAFLRIPARWLLLCLWGIMLAAGAGLRRVKSRGGLAAFMLLSVGQLLWWNSRFLGSQRVDDFLAARATMVQNMAQAPQRLITDPELANPNKTMLYRAYNANGYEAFYLNAYPAYAARSEKAAAADPSRTYLRRLDTPEMNRLGVSWRITPEGGFQSAQKALPLAYFVGPGDRPRRGKLQIERAAPERWRVSGEWPADLLALVVSQPFYPGWTGFLNGEPIVLKRWDELLQAVPRPPLWRGTTKFELHLRFVPTGWLLWVLVSAGAWGLWAKSQRQEWA